MSKGNNDQELFFFMILIRVTIPTSDQHTISPHNAATLIINQGDVKSLGYM